jgi:pectate lyase
VYQLRAGCAVCLSDIVRLAYVYQRNSLLIEHSDNAGVLGITVASDKTLIGSGTSGIIKGKGLRIVSGASNIIIQ